MKKIVAFLLCMSLMTGLTACSFSVSKPSDDSKAGVTVTTTTTEEDDDEAEESTQK